MYLFHCGFFPIGDLSLLAETLILIIPAAAT